MRARDVLDVLNRVAVFQAQSIDSHRRVDEIGGDLDSAISLLDFRQSRGQSVGEKSSSRWSHDKRRIRAREKGSDTESTLEKQEGEGKGHRTGMLQ